jgi:hypothetical protein
VFRGLPVEFEVELGLGPPVPPVGDRLQRAPPERARGAGDEEESGFGFFKRKKKKR